MSRLIVNSSVAVTLVGGSEVHEDQLMRSVSLAPHIVAADGGADMALSHGMPPSAVIGDFDSISESTKDKLPRDVQFRIEEQNSTDFDKCLRNIDAPLVICVGFTGLRADHHLAGFNALVRHPERQCILLDRNDIVFLAPPSIALSLECGTRVSLFPMGAVGGFSEGLRWPISGIDFSPDGRIGTSNEATGDVFLSLNAPKMLAILPESALEHVADTLVSNSSRWPSPRAEFH